MSPNCVNLGVSLQQDQTGDEKDANRYLDDVYIPFWNERFAVEPAESRNAHRRLSKRPDLDALFAETLTRSVANDFTIQYGSRFNETFQIGIVVICK